MKGVLECLSQKNGGSYKLLSTCSMAGMIETSAASHIIFKVLLNGFLPLNRIWHLTEFETGNFKP
jgi:hypothetical protein